MANTANSEERFDDEVEQARANMLAGEETPWSDRQAHRGEAAYVEETDPSVAGVGNAAGADVPGAFGDQGEGYRDPGDTRDNAIAKLQDQ